MADIPAKQRAVQLIGADELAFTTDKEVHVPGAHQILCKVEAVGLCFSDLKLLKQFSSHVRKSKIVSGIDPEILKEIPSYVVDDKPTVPGHEVVVRIEAVGPEVERFSTGGRYLVQADFRWLKTIGANAAFGYNCEGGLQEYVLLDERIIISPEGESMLLPVSEELSGSAIALVEPWACVEDAYVSKERQTLKAGGRMLIVADCEPGEGVFENLFGCYSRPGEITWLSKIAAPADLGGEVIEAADISGLEDAGFDDVIYFGSGAKTVEGLFAKVAAKGLLNIVLCGGKFGVGVVTMLGRIHYGAIRIVGTAGSDPADSMKYIPKTGEIRAGDKINVIGAGGPMGVMHVIRNICQGIEGVSVYAGDVDDNRLSALGQIAKPLAKENVVSYKGYNATKEKLKEQFDYSALMAPVPALAAGAVDKAANGGIINIFAGIPASVTGEIDLDTYIEKQLYFIGTSGSVLDDMKRVLAKVEQGRLDTNVSVAAISGLEGAVEGIRAVEKRAIAGKIIVYPQCRGLPLTKLKELETAFPEVWQCLSNGLWNKKAEDTLLKMYQDSEK